MGAVKKQPKEKRRASKNEALRLLRTDLRLWIIFRSKVSAYLIIAYSRVCLVLQ